MTVAVGERVTDLLESQWRVLDELCSGYDESRWDAPTELPGWSVKDVLSHINGSESWLAGRAPIDHSLEIPSYVRNPLGERNEVEVDYRRPWPGSKVLEEFRELTERRLGQLRSMSDSDFAAEGWTPVGPAPFAEFMAMRVVDCWIHEQDMRRATEVPGHLDGRIPAYVRDSLARALPKTVAKNASAADGTVAIFEIGNVTKTVVVEGSRGRFSEERVRAADVRLVMDFETFICLSCGRWDPRRLPTGRLRLEGDRALGESVLAVMNVMF